MKVTSVFIYPGKYINNTLKVLEYLSQDKDNKPVCTYMSAYYEIANGNVLKVCKGACLHRSKLYKQNVHVACLHTCTLFTYMYIFVRA